MSRKGGGAQHEREEVAKYGEETWGRLEVASSLSSSRMSGDSCMLRVLGMFRGC